MRSLRGLRSLRHGRQRSLIVGLLITLLGLLVIRILIVHNIHSFQKCHSPKIGIMYNTNIAYYCVKVKAIIALNSENIQKITPMLTADEYQ